MLTKYRTLTLFCLALLVTSSLPQEPAVAKEHQRLPEETYTVVVQEEVIETDEYLDMALPNITDSSFKPYMDYRKITSTTSTQYALQQNAVTSPEGFRLLNGKYMIAIGQYYSGQCGDEFRITFDNGLVIECVVGDVKKKKDTDSNWQYVPVNGSIIEFIIDTDIMDNSILSSGDVSGAGISGNVVKIEKKVV